MSWEGLYGEACLAKWGEEAEGTLYPLILLFGGYIKAGRTVPLRVSVCLSLSFIMGDGM